MSASLVSRGLIRVDSAPLLRVPKDSGAQADRATDRLRGDVLGGFYWKERAQWAARVASGRGDEFGRGRGILSEAARSDARLIARYCRAAWRKLRLPSPAQWSHLRASLERVFAEMQGGR